MHSYIVSFKALVQMDANKTIKLVELILAILSVVIGLIKKSFPDIENAQ